MFQVNFVRRIFFCVKSNCAKYDESLIWRTYVYDFADFLPNLAALKTLNELTACGIALGKISDKYNVIGHRQARDTECPGQSFYEYVTALPRWTANPRPIHSAIDATMQKNIVEKNSTVEPCNEISVRQIGQDPNPV